MEDTDPSQDWRDMHGVDDCRGDRECLIGRGFRPSGTMCRGFGPRAKTNSFTPHLRATRGFKEFLKLINFEGLRKLYLRAL